MEQLKVKPSQFRVNMQVKIKLFNLFEKEYIDMLPKIYEKLSNIINSNSQFTELVEKRLYNKELQKNALDELKLQLLTGLYLDDDLKQKVGSAKTIDEINNQDVLNKINGILNNSKELNYFDALYSIVIILFNNYVDYLLQRYVAEKEPALSNCRGVKDIPQCDFIIERYHQFISSLGIDATPNPPIIDEDGCVMINQGDLFHGTRYSEKVIESIAIRGLESGQLHGIEEDGETFCCIDFFKATKTTTPDEICAFGKQYTNGPKQIIFVINQSNLEGTDAMFPELTDYDAYNETTEKGLKAREIVNVAGLPLNYSNGAAILMGVPPCMISSIIINNEIENDSKKVEFLSSHFPRASIVSRVSGKVIKQPVKSFKR